MATRDIIVVGTSTGGVEALTRLAAGLPPGLAASVFVVCHFPAGGRSVLPQILSRSGPLLARHAEDGEPFYPGTIYVAPPDRHLVLTADGRTRLTRDGRENHHRPAIDPLFRSAARHYGPRAVGVVLTGALYDGAAGLMAIRNAGGLGVVQDARDAQVAAMPQNATDLAGADHLVSVADMGPLLTRLVQERVADPAGDAPMTDAFDQMPDLVRRTFQEQAEGRRKGDVSTFGCPECGGTLWQVDDRGPIRFRCHVGHAYNAEALFAEQSEALEAALWTAVRTFREKGVLGRQLERHELDKNNADAAARFREQAEQSERYAALIIKHVLNGGP